MRNFLKCAVATHFEKITHFEKFVQSAFIFGLNGRCNMPCSSTVLRNSIFENGRYSCFDGIGLTEVSIPTKKAFLRASLREDILMCLSVVICISSN